MMSSQPIKKVNRHTTAQTGEFLVASELARLGFSVALPSGSAPSYDLLAYRDGKSRVIQVKCISKGDFQFDLGKFMRIEMEKDRQLIYDLDHPPDRSIDFVIVFLGEALGRDTFLCTTLGEFIDFSKKSHESRLARFNGRRSENPRNPKSRHAAYASVELQAINIFRKISEHFYQA